MEPARDQADPCSGDGGGDCGCTPAAAERGKKVRCRDVRNHADAGDPRHHGSGTDVPGTDQDPNLRADGAVNAARSHEERTTLARASYALIDELSCGGATDPA